MARGELPELDSRPQGRREWSGWLTSLVLPLAFVVAVIGGLLYLQSSRGGPDGSDAFGTVALPDALNPTGKTPQATVGRAAPDFVLPALDESTLHFSDMQGKAHIVTFFTTWCEACRGQMPAIIDAWHASDGDFTVLGIDLQEADDRVRQFVADYGIDFVVLLDRAGDVGATWKVGGRGEPLPATFFIDASGVVRQVIAGPATAADLAEGVSLLRGKD